MTGDSWSWPICRLSLADHVALSSVSLGDVGPRLSDYGDKGPVPELPQLPDDDLFPE